MGRIPFYCAAALASFCGLTLASMQAQEGNDLRTPSAFSEITDTTARSRALFGEMAKVIMHPRCMNCHPAGDRPTQGNDMHPHMPPVWRAAGLCLSCHTQGNYTLHERATYRSIPGHIRWDVAPIEMAWQDKTAGEICQQLKDPARNGGRTLALLREHLAHDDLVAWGWHPGEGRDPAPGAQERLGELVAAWIETGASCP
jgi:hypothetical protein